MDGAHESVTSHDRPLSSAHLFGPRSFDWAKRSKTWLHCHMTAAIFALLAAIGVNLPMTNCSPFELSRLSQRQTWTSASRTLSTGHWIAFDVTSWTTDSHSRRQKPLVCQLRIFCLRPHKGQIEKRSRVTETSETFVLGWRPCPQEPDEKRFSEVLTRQLLWQVSLDSRTSIIGKIFLEI